MSGATILRLDMVHDPSYIDCALRNLTPRQEKAIRMRYGIGCERGHTTFEMAQEYDRSPRQIQRYLERGMVKLRTLLGETVVQDLRSIQGLQVLLRVPEFEEHVEIVSAFHRLLRKGEVGQAELLALTARQFEELVAEVWGRLGYTVELTASTRDGGRDVIAVRQSEARVRYLIECKRYDSMHKVGVRFVRALYGVKCDEGATKAFLATTTTFSRDALRFFGRHEWDMEPRDYQGVIDWIQMAQKRDRKSGLWIPSSPQI
jgi:hypothetical protein